jgi:hypothetical protein
VIHMATSTVPTQPPIVSPIECRPPVGLFRRWFVLALCAVFERLCPHSCFVTPFARASVAKRPGGSQ